MAEFISATYDVVFKALFVRNPKLLREFLRDVIRLPLPANAEIVIKNPELSPSFADGKTSRLDIFVEMANRQFNVEMQAKRYGFSSDRTGFYLCKAYVDSLKAGHDYEELPETYSVNVLDFNIYDCARYHTSFTLREDQEQFVFFDKLSIHILELPKVPKELVGDNNEQMWMELIKANSEEKLAMIKDTACSAAIQEGVDAVLALNADDEIREKIRSREDSLRDYYSGLAHSHRMGKEEGLAEGLEKGLVKGREEGREEGIEKGIEKGREEERRKLAESLRKNGFTEDQIRKLLETE